MAASASSPATLPDWIPSAPADEPGTDQGVVRLLCPTARIVRCGNRLVIEADTAWACSSPTTRPRLDATLAWVPVPGYSPSRRQRGMGTSYDGTLNRFAFHDLLDDLTPSAPPAASSCPPPPTWSPGGGPSRERPAGWRAVGASPHRPPRHRGGSRVTPTGDPGRVAGAINDDHDDAKSCYWASLPPSYPSRGDVLLQYRLGPPTTGPPAQSTGPPGREASAQPAPLVMSSARRSGRRPYPPAAACGRAPRRQRGCRPRPTPLGPGSSSVTPMTSSQA